MYLSDLHPLKFLGLLSQFYLDDLAARQNSGKIERGSRMACTGKVSSPFLFISRAVIFILRPIIFSTRFLMCATNSRRSDMFFGFTQKHHCIAMKYKWQYKT